MRKILGVLVIAVLIVGCGGAASTQAPAAPSAEPTQSAASISAPVATASATPSASGAFGGIVHYQLDGAPATTEVDAVADGASVSGTAVTTFRAGTHSVRLECASRNGDTWALAGKVEETTVPGEKAGDWSVVIVRDGSPQHISIWLPADPESVGDCDALASNDFSTIGLEDLSAVESGTLVPPPDLAP